MPNHFFTRSLYYFARVLAALYLFTWAYASVAVVFKTEALNSIENGERFEIFFPFSRTPFLLGDYNWYYIVFDFLAVLLLYGLFFLLLGNVFYTFMQPKIFTRKGYLHLRNFYLFNLLLPVVAVVVTAIFSTMEMAVVVIVVLHLVIGIFAYFLAAIFKQGLNLQTEQDLII